MGLTAPPRPLTEEEFNKAIAEGATTLEEIDPRFARWYKIQRRTHLFSMSVLLVGAIMLIAMAIMVFWKGSM